MLVDMSDGYKYVGQKGSATMPYTCLYSIHHYKAGVKPDVTPLGSPHASKKECRREIHSAFETHEEGQPDTQSPTGAISGSTKWAFNKNFKKRKICQPLDVDLQCSCEDEYIHICRSGIG